MCSGKVGGRGCGLGDRGVFPSVSVLVYASVLCSARFWSGKQLEDLPPPPEIGL